MSLDRRFRRNATGSPLRTCDTIRLRRVNGACSAVEERARNAARIAVDHLVEAYRQQIKVVLVETDEHPYCPFDPDASAIFRIHDDTKVRRVGGDAYIAVNMSTGTKSLSLLIDDDIPAFI